MTEELKKAKKAALQLLARRAKTVKQLRAALKRRNFPAAVTDRVIAELLQNNYLNDRRFAADYIALRLARKPYGPYLLRALLRQAGVEDKIIEQELAKVFVPGKEKELAVFFIEQVSEDCNKDIKKIMRKLLSRGFSRQASVSALYETGMLPADADLDIMS